MKSQEPPKRVLKLLEWICPDDLIESIAGDLEEKFNEDKDELGFQIARLNYIYQALLFIRPGILFRNKFNYFIPSALFKSYLIIAGRNMAKKKLFSLINSAGLGLGIALCILIALFILDEKSFDQFHINKDDIYRVEKKYYKNTGEGTPGFYMYSAYIQTCMGPTLKSDFPQVKYFTRFNNNNHVIVHSNGKVYTDKVSYVDPDFTEMFSFKILKGQTDYPLKELHHAVITPAVAIKYFGDKDPIGQSIRIDHGGEKEYTITAIIENAPPNSSLDYGILIRQDNKPYYDEGMSNWRSFSTPTFVQLVSNADTLAFKSGLDKIIKLHMSDYLEKNIERYNIPEGMSVFEYNITSLNDIHLDTKSDWTKASDPKYSVILGSIALLILLIAAVNYVLLALSASTSRKTEVGIRKTIGAARTQVMTQFVIESVFISIVSSFIGLILVYIFLPYFNEFTQKSILLDQASLSYILILGLILALVIGSLAGSYPAFYLSAFRPILALKGGSSGRLRLKFSKPLIVLQFAISAFLIISSLIMYHQMEYITSKDLGYDKEHVLVLPTQRGFEPGSKNGLELFREKLSSDPNILGVSGTSSAFCNGWSRYGYTIDGQYKTAYVYNVDQHYLDLLDIELIDGRNFDSKFGTDTNAIIVNEALVNDMAWENPLEERLNWMEDSASKGSRIIGVMKDYHFLSLENKIQPLFLTYNYGNLVDILIKVRPEKVQESIEKIGSVWQDLYPDQPFDYSFLDQDLKQQYANRDRWMNIMSLATFFAIFLSCLGLFGLSGINAQGRLKEMGIRKVYGAGVTSIVVLLNKEFVILSIISIILAIPVSWYIMNDWLGNFEYGIKISFGIISIGVLAGLVIAIATVSYHAFRTAFTNPIEFLKEE